MSKKPKTRKGTKATREGARTVKTKTRAPDTEKRPTKKGKPDPGGLKKTFKTRTDYGGKVKGPPKGSGGPPSAKAREDRAKSTREPPPVKYGGKKKVPKKTGYPEWDKLPDWPPKMIPGKRRLSGISVKKKK